MILLVIMAVFCLATTAWSGKGAKPSPLISIDHAKDAKGTPGYTLTAYIHAEPKAVFDIIADTAHVQNTFPDVNSVSSKNEGSGNPNITKILWKQTFKTPLGEKVLNVLMTQNHKELTMQWIRTSGDFADFQGNAKVEPAEGYPGWTKLIYTNFIDAGGHLPQFLTDRSNKHSLAALVPNIENILHKSAK